MLATDVLTQPVLMTEGPYYTAADLSQIAHKLDEQEQQERYDDEHRPRASTNMDDTGFFSVQVLEEALQVWGLTLVPWRSERMRPYHDHPHTQLAFILNSIQHWYTLRRFGRVSPNPALEADPGGAHWFDLNSFLPQPQWISKTYLGMVLHQAEIEGYSVFAVIQIDPAGKLAVPRTEGDEFAQTLEEPSDAWYQQHAVVAAPQQPAAAAMPAGGHPDDFDFEDEDMELQAALQASLMGSGGDPYSQYSQGESSRGQTAQSEHYRVPITTGTPPVAQSSHYRVPITTPSDSGSQPHTPVDPSEAYSNIRRNYDVLRPRNDVEEEVDDNLLPAIQDPVAASRARAQALMEQARREQEAALRDTYAEDEARTRAGLPSRRNTRQEQEDADLQRAIEESRALHEAQLRRASTSSSPEEMEEDDDLYQTPREQSEPASPTAAYRETHRVYDDDDAELQAALKASLESVPAGFTIPSPPPRPQRPQEVAPAQASVPPPTTQEEHDTETESEAEESNISEEPPAELTLEEIRRRRLEKFGR
ncbi:hypothetical protein NM688_g1160 [Phlebia brevispora]|uniref:Uncharacterized protein n=1 Tax=Phlebia brevispora TaxID=194682 RepID=A0ACC1TC00_9APHY|nr:hypothetical protein NM688_g1160 [Phlebia brevispora]